MYDVILVLGGGIDDNAKPYEWVERRLDKAIEVFKGEPIMLCTRGTVHKPQKTDKDGFVIDEAVPMGEYLHEKGIPREKILLENISLDTVGNAYFARTVHIDPMKWRKLVVITSKFHMPRSEEIFKWIFGLEPKHDYNIEYITVSDEGLDENLIKSRTEKEKKSIQRLLNVEKNIKTMEQLHQWLYTVHDAYAFGITPERAKGEVVNTY